jgi:hypothetical protein
MYLPVLGSLRMELPRNSIGERMNQIAWIIRPVALQGLDVIDNIAGACAGSFASGRARIRTLECSPMGWVAHDAPVIRDGIMPSP